MRRTLVLCLALLVVVMLAAACGSDPSDDAVAGDEIDVGVPFDDDIPFTAFFADERDRASGGGAALQLDEPDEPDEVAGIAIEADALEDGDVIRVPLQDRIEALGDVVPPDETAAPPIVDEAMPSRGQREAPVEMAPTAGSAASPRGNRGTPTQRP